MAFAELSVSIGTSNGTAQVVKCIVEVQSASQSPDGNLNAEFTVLNNSSIFLTNMTYHAVLQKPAAIGQPGEIPQKIMSFDGTLSDISLKNASRFSISHKLPDSIETGSYELFILVNHSETSICGFALSNSIQLQGTGGWIASPEGVIRAGLVDMNLFDGTPIKENTDAIVLLPFSMNPSFAQKSSLGQYSVSAQLFNRNDSKKSLFDFNNIKVSVIDDAKYGQAISFTLPLKEKSLGPGDYDVFVDMFDEKNSKVASFEFKWIIAGLSLKIGDVSFSKGSITKGQPISVSMNLLVPLPEAPKENVLMELKFFGKSGEEVSFSKTVMLSNSVMPVEFSDIAGESMGINSIYIKATSQKSGLVLDEYSSEVPSFPNTESTANQANDTLFIAIAAIIIVVLVVGTAIFYSKKRKII